MRYRTTKFGCSVVSQSSTLVTPYQQRQPQQLLWVLGFPVTVRCDSCGSNPTKSAGSFLPLCEQTMPNSTIDDGRRSYWQRAVRDQNFEYETTTNRATTSKMRNCSQPHTADRLGASFCGSFSHLYTSLISPPRWGPGHQPPSRAGGINTAGVRGSERPL